MRGGPFNCCWQWHTAFESQLLVKSGFECREFSLTRVVLSIFAINHCCHPPLFAVIIKRLRLVEPFGCLGQLLHIFQMLLLNQRDRRLVGHCLC